MREIRFKEGANALIVLLNTLIDSVKPMVPRYRCKTCCKTFTDTTNTILFLTRKRNKWITFVESMFNRYSLRKSAEIIGVSWVTLLYWRHKLLSALKQMDFEQFGGIVEVDETYFLYSKKKVVFLTANLVSIKENLNTGVLVTNRSLFLLPEPNKNNNLQSRLYGACLEN